jgi:hypothetical protein
VISKADAGDTTNVAPEAPGKATYVVELDDKLDEDLMNLLLEPPMLKDYYVCSTEVLPGVRGTELSNMQCICLVKSIPAIDSDKDSNPDQTIAQAFASIFTNLMFKMRNMRPCCLSGVKTEVQMDDDDDIQIVLTAMVVALSKEGEKTHSPELEDKEVPPLNLGHKRSNEDLAMSPRSKSSMPSKVLKSPDHSTSKSSGSRSAVRRKNSKRRSKVPLSSSDDESLDSDASDTETSGDEDKISPRVPLSAPKPIPSTNPRSTMSPRKSSPRSKQLAGSISSFSPSSSFEDKNRSKIRARRSCCPT